MPRKLHGKANVLLPKPPRKKEPVLFKVKFRKSADPFKIKAEFDQLSSGLNVYVNQLKRICITLIGGSTNQRIYEKVFGGKLKYVSRMVTNLNHPDRVVWEWKEEKPAQVPRSLQDVGVEKIGLATLFYLDD